MPWCLDRSLPCDTACTINDALFELLLCGLEVGTRIHVRLGAYDESANAGVGAIWIAYVKRTCLLIVMVMVMMCDFVSLRVVVL